MTRYLNTGLHSVLSQKHITFPSKVLSVPSQTWPQGGPVKGRQEDPPDLYCNLRPVQATKRLSQPNRKMLCLALSVIVKYLIIEYFCKYVIKIFNASVVTHICNPSTFKEDKQGPIRLRNGEFQASLGYQVRNTVSVNTPLGKKNQSQPTTSIKST